MQCDVLGDALESCVMPAQVMQQDGYTILIPPDPSSAPLLIVMTAALGWTMPVSVLSLGPHSTAAHRPRSNPWSQRWALFTSTHFPWGAIRLAAFPSLPHPPPSRPTPYIYSHRQIAAAWSQTHRHSSYGGSAFVAKYITIWISWVFVLVWCERAARPCLVVPATPCPPCSDLAIDNDTTRS